MLRYNTIHWCHVMFSVQVRLLPLYQCMFLSISLKVPSQEMLIVQDLQVVKE